MTRGQVNWWCSIIMGTLITIIIILLLPTLTLRQGLTVMALVTLANLFGYAEGLYIEGRYK